MKYVVSQEIDLISTNVTDETYTPWSSGATYNTGDIVIESGNTKVKYKYAGISGSNSSSTPSQETTKWIPAPTNPYAMVDGVVGSQTTNPDSIEVSFHATNIDTISFFNIEADSIEITMTDNMTNTVFYDKSFDMTYDELADFGDYLFSEQELRDLLTDKLSTVEMQAVVDSMSGTEIMDRFTATPPIYYDCTVTISINRSGGVAKCGYLVVGRQKDLGMTLWNSASSGIISFSKKERNSYWGDVELVKGEVADTMSLQCMLDNDSVDIVRNRLKAIDGIPCVFIGDEGGKFSSLTLYGFFLDFDVPLSPAKSVYTLKIESLI